MIQPFIKIGIQNSAFDDISIVYIDNTHKAISISNEKTEKQAWKQAAIRLRQLANEAQKRYDELNGDD